MVAGLGLVSAGAGRWSLVQDWLVAGICWCRKMVAGSRLVVAVAERVAADIFCCRNVIAGAGRRLLVQGW